MIRTLLAMAAVVAGLTTTSTATACQPEYCPPQPLLCEVGPLAGSCIYPY